jgi:hypothetical protein
MSAHLADAMLAAHADGTLSPPERAAADAHLEVCVQCRDELELAGRARAALRSLPIELRPPVDVAGAAVREVTGRGAAPETASEPPRRHRAAAVVAVAAAIGLAALVAPKLGGSDEADRAASGGTAAEASVQAPRATAAVGTEAGSGTTDGQNVGQNADDETSVPFRSVAGELDDAALSELLRTPSRTAALSDEPAAANALSADERGTALSCLRIAAGDLLSTEAAPVQLIDGTYRETRAFVGIYESTSDDRDRLLVVAAQDGCRLLASGSGASGAVTPSE